MKMQMQQVQEQEKSSGYQPTKEEMEKDVSIPVDPELLGQAIVSGGAPPQEEAK